jgi:hypothetical protein
MRYGAEAMVVNRFQAFTIRAVKIPTQAIAEQRTLPVGE